MLNSLLLAVINSVRNRFVPNTFESQMILLSESPDFQMFFEMNMLSCDFRRFLLCYILQLFFGFSGHACDRITGEFSQSSLM